MNTRFVQTSILNSNSETKWENSKTTTLPEQSFQYLDLPEPYDTAERIKQQAIFNTLYSAARLRFKCWSLPYHADDIFRTTIKHFIRRNASLISMAVGTNPSYLTLPQAKKLIENGLVTPSKHNTKSTTRKHKCILCRALGAKPRSFRRIKGLREHNMSHLNIKPYKCAGLRRFKSSHDLEYHKMTYKCSTDGVCKRIKIN